MSILTFDDAQAFGSVMSVDTSSVVVQVSQVEKLRGLQVNRLVALHSSKPGQYLIGMVTRITRQSIGPAGDHREEDRGELELEETESNTVKVALIGTLIGRVGAEQDLFRRTLETVPEIDARCFTIEGDNLSSFMQVISEIEKDATPLSLGAYTLDERAESFLNGDRFFQRHAILVGSTGSGKSWTTARIIEQLASLPGANAVLFDTHGEYKPLSGPGIRHFKLVGPGDLDDDPSLETGYLFLPFWLLSYEALVSIFVDRSDQNAPNQAMVIHREITELKRAFLESNGHSDVLKNFTIDSPVPFDMDHLLERLNELNTEMVAGSGSREKQGDFHGKLSRLIARLTNRVSDRRLGFLFHIPEAAKKYDWLPELTSALLGSLDSQPDATPGVKVIDFSEVPSDILPLVTSLVASIIFSIQHWTPKAKCHPIALICDEAHNYIPERASDDGPKAASVAVFERIAKEGRKYGVSLVVISQRPSEVNRTVLSQCNNLVAMRLTNAEDQSVIRRLLPDSVGNLADLLPILDVGEALVVGDACLLPSRVRVAQPTQKPNSGTIPFWKIWSAGGREDSIEVAVESWRRQSL